MEFEFLSLLVEIMPPLRGRGRRHKIPMDEKATSDFHTRLPHVDHLVPPKFLVPPMPQIRLLPPMTLKAFQALPLIGTRRLRHKLKPKLRPDNANFSCHPWHHLFHHNSANFEAIQVSKGSKTTRL